MSHSSPNTSLNASHCTALNLSLAALQQNNLAAAILHMQQAAELAPEIILYKRNLGELLRRAGQLEAAIATLTIAVNIEPQSAENHFLLGLAYNDKREFALSVQHYRIALSYNKNDGLTWNNLGASLENMGDKLSAKAAYATAISLNTNHTEAQNNLAAIYSEEGLLNEARTHFTAAISRNPEFVDAHYNLSLIKTYTLDDPHLGFLESMLQKSNYFSINQRIQYYFALGKALDDTKQYARAFQAYAEGNRLHYLYRPWDKTKLEELVTQLPIIFNKTFLKQAPIAKDTHCPIFIVGMPRSGTTLIEQILASHRDIYGAGELSILDEIIQEACHAANKPLNIWISQLSDNEFAMLGQTYLKHTSQLAPDKKFIIDKMPGNCFYIGMIYRMLPNAKIIHAMRDPMDSCFSCFTHLFKDNMSFAYDQTALGTYYKLYAQAMQHWQTVLPENTIFNLPYEHMIESHEDLAKQLVAYIGLPWDPKCLNFYENNRMVKTASLTQVRKPIYKTSVQRWRHFTEELAPLLQIVASYRTAYAYTLHLSGVNAYQAGNTTAGIRLIQQAIACHPTVALFYSNLCEMYRQLKNLDLSIQHGRRAVELDPNSAASLSNLGIAYYDASQYEQAEDCHQRALAINPTLACSLNNMGSIYKHFGKMQNAIDYYQAAMAAAPTFAEPINNLGWAYYDVAKIHLNEYDFIEAENTINKAIAINPKQAEYFQLIADIHHEQGRDDTALMYLDQALAIDPLLASTYISKGNVLMEMGEIAEAEKLFSRLMYDASVDTQVMAHYCLAQLRKCKTDNTSFQTLLTLAENIQQVSPDKREYAYFALGKYHNDMGEWQKAFSYFTQGCNLKRKRITYNIDEQIQLTNNIIKNMTKDTMEHLRSFAHPSALPIFIVGMPRSGTTLVEQIIASHSTVHGAGELTYLANKTSSYYPVNISHLSPEIYYSIIENYLAYLQQFSADATRITDKMPQNFTLIGLIHTLFPNAKIIHVKRNSIDTCLSCYTKLFSKGHHYSYDLTELGQYYNCYKMLMDHWRNILPVNAWHEINYEDIIQNTEAEAKKLLAYCNLNWEPACLDFYKDNRTVRTASFMQVRQPVYTTSLNRWRRFENELSPLIEILSQQ